MLILSRRLHQKIVLPGLGVTLTVVAVDGNAVRLGIEAPPDVRVLREELSRVGSLHLGNPAAPDVSRGGVGPAGR